MGPYRSSDEIPFKVLNKWFEHRKPLLADLYTPKSGGAGSTYLLNDLESMKQLIAGAKSNDVITVFENSIVWGEPYSEKFLNNFMGVFEQGFDWFLTEKIFPEVMEEIAAGETKEELTKDFNEEVTWLKENQIIYAGYFRDLPNYWEDNNQKDVLIIIKE